MLIHHPLVPNDVDSNRRMAFSMGPISSSCVHTALGLVRMIRLLVTPEMVQRLGKKRLIIDLLDGHRKSFIGYRLL